MSNAKKQACLNITYNDMTIKSNENLYEIGVDEVGRGPLFGRVYCGAVILPKDGNFDYELMKDSKKFTSKNKIIKVAQYIKDNAISWSVMYQDENSIDENNIRQATFMAMHNAIKKIIDSYDSNNTNNTNNINSKYYLLVDGNDFKPYLYMNKNSSMIEQIPHINIEGGDNKYCAIAAASILAKVERDKYILDLCEEYPKLSEYYALEKNMGYGTKLHMEGLIKYGISPWHRKSYGPCKERIVNKPEFYKN
jgi:ribonuclease HII